MEGVLEVRAPAERRGGEPSRRRSACATAVRGAAVPLATTAALAPVAADAVSIAMDPNPVPKAIGKRAPAFVRYQIETVELDGRLDDGTSFTYWTFGRKVPGPMLRVKKGDTVELTLVEREEQQGDALDRPARGDRRARRRRRHAGRAGPVEDGALQGAEPRPVRVPLRHALGAASHLGRHVRPDPGRARRRARAGGSRVLRHAGRPLHHARGRHQGPPRLQPRARQRRAADLLHLQRRRRRADQGVQDDRQGRRDGARVLRRRRTEQGLLVPRDRRDLRHGLQRGVGDVGQEGRPDHARGAGRRDHRRVQGRLSGQVSAGRPRPVACRQGPGGALEVSGPADSSIYQPLSAPELQH